MNTQFDTETEVVLWIKQQREAAPWITETGLVEAAFAAGLAAADPQDDYDRGYEDGFADGCEVRAVADGTD